MIKFPTPYEWWSNALPPGQEKASNARGMSGEDVEASIWLIHKGEVFLEPYVYQCGSQSVNLTSFLIGQWPAVSWACSETAKVWVRNRGNGEIYAGEDQWTRQGYATRPYPDLLLDISPFLLCGCLIKLEWLSDSRNGITEHSTAWHSEEGIGMPGDFPGNSMVSPGYGNYPFFRAKRSWFRQRNLRETLQNNAVGVFYKTRKRFYFSRISVWFDTPDWVPKTRPFLLVFKACKLLNFSDICLAEKDFNWNDESPGVFS